MPSLIFLTGAPASGKSTLARRLVAERPLALLLDLDTLRGQLGDWRADPASAGVRAREIGLAIARAQLAAGGDVVVPQFVRRPELVEQFRELASLTGGRFRLVALVSGAAEAAARDQPTRTTRTPSSSSPRRVRRPSRSCTPTCSRCSPGSARPATSR